jgi:hypothetical protein
LLLVYTGDDAQQIALIADVNRFCRPDLAVWCVDSLGVAHAEILQRARAIDQQLAPRIGIFVVASDPLPELTEGEKPSDPRAPMDETDTRVRILNAGFDVSRLLPIVDALVSSGVTPGLT